MRALHRLALYAPIDGRILNIKVKPGEDAGGGPCTRRWAMTTSSMRAVAEVYETDIAGVRLRTTGNDQPSFALYLDQSPARLHELATWFFKNDVLNVDPAARADARRLVEVWIDLEAEPLVQQLTNLTVNVRINTSEADVFSPRIKSSVRALFGPGEC